MQQMSNKLIELGQIMTSRVLEQLPLHQNTMNNSRWQTIGRFQYKLSLTQLLMESLEYHLRNRAGWQ